MMTRGGWDRIAAGIVAIARSPDFGRSDLRPRSPLTRKEKAAFAFLLVAFLALALGADLLPGRRFHFEAQLARMTPFFELDRLTPAMRYYPGNAVGSFRSLPYMLALKTVHALVPGRLLSLRLVSVAATALSLAALFCLACRLFCPGVALLWIFSLVFSPLWLESMRAYGYIPFTHLFVVLGCLVLARPGEGRGAPAKAGGLALVVYATLSLYLPARLIFWLSLIYLALNPRREWRTLLLFIVLFFGGTILVDTLIGDDALNFRDFLFPEISGEWVMQGGRMEWKSLASNVVRNAPLLFRSLVPSAASLFPPLSAALFGVGIVLCLLLRRRSNVFFLLWLGVFVFSPLTSNALPLRRVVFSLDPIHLSGALGAWYLVRLAGSVIGPGAPRRRLGSAALVLLLLVGLVSARKFLLEVSRPEAKPSREYLENLAAFILERGESSVLVLYDEKLSDLIWANPAFADRVSASLNPRVIAVSPPSARKFHQAGLERSPRPSLVLYHRAEEKAYRALFSWAAGVFGEEPVRGDVPGTDIEFALLPCPPGLAPELLTTAGGVVSASSSPRREESAWVRRPNIQNDLTDWDPTVFWAPAPDAAGGAPWVQVDFGPGPGKTVRLVGLLPGGATPSAKGFLRRGRLYGGRDGRDWELLAKIEETTPDPRTLWRYWVVPNDRAFRYYRLVISEPPAGKFRGLGDIALYESDSTYILRFRSEAAIVRRAEK